MKPGHPARSLTLTVNPEEHNWVKHAAALCRMPVNEFIKRAVNERLERMGVDAVLLRVPDRGLGSAGFRKP